MKTYDDLARLINKEEKKLIDRGYSCDESLRFTFINLYGCEFGGNENEIDISITFNKIGVQEVESSDELYNNWQQAYNILHDFLRAGKQHYYSDLFPIKKGKPYHGVILT